MADQKEQEQQRASSNRVSLRSTLGASRFDKKINRIEEQVLAPEATSFPGMVSAKPGPVGADFGLSQRKWEVIYKELFSRRVPGPSRGDKAMRKFLEATLWVACSKMRWADLPADYGNWHSIYVRFTRWSNTGRWSRFIHALQRHDEQAMAHQLSVLVAGYQYRHMVRNMRQKMRNGLVDDSPVQHSAELAGDWNDRHL